jgi:hypothetical protein
VVLEAVEAVDATLRKVRVVAILAATPSVGLDPLPAEQFHSIAYFADALAPVWGLRIIDEQLLKRRSGPLSPSLQRDIDHLVGRGVVVPHKLRHVLDADKKWRLDASYSLNEDFAAPILVTTAKFDAQRVHLAFVREVVYAMSRLGLVGIVPVSAEDASYGDATADAGSLVDLETTDEGPNPTASVALRFNTLVEPTVDLSSAEMVHLYVQQLSERLGNVA